MTEKQFDYDTLIEILENAEGYGREPDRYKVVNNEMVETTRWGLVYQLVFYDKEEGTYWQTLYEIGKTELQESMPFEYESDRTCVQVEPREKTTIEYITVKD